MLDPNRGLVQQRQRLFKRLCSVVYRLGKPLPPHRPRVLLLGSGWSSLYFIDQIDPRKNDVTVVSPRPFFVFTPLLTSSLGGILSSRSILEPIRKYLFFGGRKSMQYLQGRAESVDFEKNEVACASANGVFKVPFDRLVFCVGADINTFGIPGVRENCSFLKEIEDAREIRLKIFDAFEKASVIDKQTHASAAEAAAEKQRLLSFVIVGGGATGVEAAGELQDLLKKEMRALFPDLVPFAKITVIEMLPKLMPQFSEKSSTFIMDTFDKIKIEKLTRHTVQKVEPGSVTVLDQQDKQSKVIPANVVVWTTGLAQTPLIKGIMAQLKEQAGNRVLRVGSDLRVLGCENVYALGDCAIVTPPKLADRVDELYEMAKDTPYGAGVRWLKSVAGDFLTQGYSQLHVSQLQLEDGGNHLSRKDFEALLKKVDSGYKPPVATAQMARQAGAYLATVFNSPGKTTLPYAPTNFGQMAYIGGGRSVIELMRRRGIAGSQTVNLAGGRLHTLFWHGFYWFRQTSAANRTQSLVDYSKKFVWGRDITEVSSTSTARH